MWTVDYPLAKWYRKLSYRVKRAIAADGRAEILVYRRFVAYLSHDYDCLLQSPAIAEDCYILVVLFIFFYFFFRPPNFRHPWADFRETLPHDAVCAEIVYLL